MVERDLAKVEVASSTLVSRSKISEATQGVHSQRRFNCLLFRIFKPDQGRGFLKSQFRNPKSEIEVAA